MGCHCFSDSRAMFGLFLSATNKAHIFVLDTVRTNQMPNMNNLYQTERTNRCAVCLSVCLFTLTDPVLFWLVYPVWPDLVPPIHFPVRSSHSKCVWRWNSVAYWGASSDCWPTTRTLTKDRLWYLFRCKWVSYSKTWWVLRSLMCNSPSVIM